jgi:hypothetical protein
MYLFRIRHGAPGPFQNDRLNSTRNLQVPPEKDNFLRNWDSVGLLKWLLLHALSLKLVDSETRLRFYSTYSVVSLEFQQGIL